MAPTFFISPLFCSKKWVRVAPALFSTNFRRLFGSFGESGGVDASGLRGDDGENVAALTGSAAILFKDDMEDFPFSI